MTIGDDGRCVLLLGESAGHQRDVGLTACAVPCWVLPGLTRGRSDVPVCNGHLVRVMTDTMPPAGSSPITPPCAVVYSTFGWEQAMASGANWPLASRQYGRADQVAVS